MARLRKDVAALDQDRYLAPDLATVADLVASGAFLEVVPDAHVEDVRP